ncbi:hypothetical protein [Intrasporangium sp.]|uniref:hypothetical protein n=1 Tax=Intrasporangium sp. TaxID=1925024 RepID=UPI00293A2C85|nr:hypothetical protein [Intrasporangium sp.]MDV3221013.1 hypothetical protein [Intrasporangium sp.]
MDAEFRDGPEPVAPGFWMTVVGSIVAVLAPLAGFLGGSSTGAFSRENALGVWLIVGLVIGGLGVLLAFVGGQRWWRSTHH